MRIEEGRSDLQEYEERAGKVARGDVEGWLALGDWAKARGLGTQASEAYHRALAVSPGDPRANEALGNVRVDGRWVSEDESYRARGYVQYEGEWISQAEHEAMLRERAAEDARDGSCERRRRTRARRRRARRRRRRGLARRMRSRRAKASRCWYGWGAGPAYWPTGPVVRPPVAPSRPIARPGAVPR